jgi:hypothetical protein
MGNTQSEARFSMTLAPKRHLSYSLRTLFVVVTLASLAIAAWRSMPRNVTFAETQRVKFGMTRDEVRQAIGEPASKQPWHDREIWQYFQSMFGWESFWVEFDANGLVVSDWI